eukprot:scaffold3863_cov166-Isochrysis_galbana.AAC.2
MSRRRTATRSGASSAVPAASRAVRGGVLSASVEDGEVVGGGVCSFEQLVSAARVDSRTDVVSRISSIAGSNGAALWLTLLSCAGSRGRFGDEAISMTVSFGAEAEGAARASAGNCSMLTQK